jgi:hypothetical protein
VLTLDNAVIRFGEAASDARGGDTIVGVDLLAVDQAAALAAASLRGLPVEGEAVTICGIRFRP